MNILVTGSTGLVGSAVVQFLTTGGHRVLRLVRIAPRNADEIAWNPTAGTIDADKLEGVDAVVHLAGDNIAHGRWSAAKKARIRDSRVLGTRLLSTALAKLNRKPRVFVCASAIGYYGHRGDEVMTESSPPGLTFISTVCRDWEAATEPARQAGIRVVNLRIGVVLTPRGGALAKMLTPFKLCVGGVVGTGRQYWSWIALDDVVGAIHHAITHDELSGPVNAVSPEPLANAAFTKILGRVLHRPTIAPLPAFVVKLMLGEMGDELLLASTRVLPNRLQETGYQFRCPTLEGALRHVLGR
ncbi:MAG: TIGR01777 family oxidoreductase [Planctomycetaceae bacterium]